MEKGKAIDPIKSFTLIGVGVRELVPGDSIPTIDGYIDPASFDGPVFLSYIEEEEDSEFDAYLVDRKGIVLGQVNSIDFEE
jgi:hypothetical protein